LEQELALLKSQEQVEVKISLTKKHFEERKKFAKKEEGRVRTACYLSHYL
jgi:hypothetical protein